MGACASKFTVLKNVSDAPPPAVDQEVESKEVNPVEEVAVKKDDAALEEDEANRRHSLGHLLSENEEKKGSVECNATEVKPEAVADAPAHDETEKTSIGDSLKSKEILAFQSVATEAETVKLESKDGVDTLKTEKPEILQPEKVEEKPAEVAKCETSETEKTEVEKVQEKPVEVANRETPETEKTEVEKPISDTEKKETDEKSTATAVIETLEKKPEVAEEQKLTTEAKTNNAEGKKPESPEVEKIEREQAADTEKETKDKPAEDTKVETTDSVDVKQVLDPQTTEKCSDEKTSSEVQKTASDAEKPKTEEKANS